jgi:hypothetical protein
MFATHALRIHTLLVMTLKFARIVPQEHYAIVFFDYLLAD